MRFRAIAALFFWMLCSACSGGRDTWKLPAELEGGYKASAAPADHDLAAAAAKLNALSSQVAAYEGPAKFVAGVFELPPGLAFEAHQKWRPVPGRIAFSRGVYFVILESETMSATDLSRVASVLEKAIPAR